MAGSIGRRADMIDLRGLVKGTAELALCRSGVASLVRRRRAGDTIVLAYHNVVPDGLPVAGDRSLHLTQRAFAGQLDLIRRTHDVVPLPAVLERSAGRRPRAVITFDDAYQGALTAGVEELERRRLPATVFVTPAFVGGRSFWWDALTQPGAAAPPAELRRHALDGLRGLDAEVRAWALAHGHTPRDMPAHQTCATEEQLRAAAGAGVAYGSHTWSHAYLPALAGDALRHELDAPRPWLAERFGEVVNWLAYPYGGLSPGVVEATREAGYDGAVRVEGGWAGTDVEARRDPHRVPRQNVAAGLSRAGFELRVSGLLAGR